MRHPGYPKQELNDEIVCPRREPRSPRTGRAPLIPGDNSCGHRMCRGVWADRAKQRAVARSEIGANRAQRRAVSTARDQVRQTDPDQIVHRGATADGHSGRPVVFELSHEPASGLQPSAFFSRQRPRAAMPALAIWASSADFTPLTPTAPTQCPSTMMGTPPSSSPCRPGALRNEARPWLIMSS